ncbi:unnamed protein product, partial [Staurois parvus]
MNHESALGRVIMLELWCLSNEMYKDDCLKKKHANFHNRRFIKLSINAQVYIEISDTFLIPSIERMFGDDDIFQD